MPGYAVQWIEIEGPFYDDPVGGAGYRLLFDELQLRRRRRRGPACRWRAARLRRPVRVRGGGRRPGVRRAASAVARSARRPYEVESAEPRKDAERLLRAS